MLQQRQRALTGEVIGNGARHECLVPWSPDWILEGKAGIGCDELPRGGINGTYI